MHWPISLLCLLCLLTPAWAGDRLGLVYDLQTKELLSIINTAQQGNLDKPGFYVTEGQGFIAVEKSEITTEMKISDTKKSLKSKDRMQARTVISTGKAQQYVRDHAQ